MRDATWATGRSYDVLAEEYDTWIRDELAHKPFDRAVLATFAELLRSGGHGAVADIGCGQGRITAYLHDLGVDVFGMDLSRGMLERARAAYPSLRFVSGSMTELVLDAGSLGGIVAWYSIIHVPDEQLRTIFVAFERVLAPGGYLQLAFQTGDGEIEHRNELAGIEVSLDFHRRDPSDVADLLAKAGLPVVATLVRGPDEAGPYPEATPQAYLLARKPPDRP